MSDDTALTDDERADAFHEAVLAAMAKYDLGHIVVAYRLIGSQRSSVVAFGSGLPGDDAIADRVCVLLRETMNRHCDDLNRLAKEAERVGLDERN